MKVGNGRYRFDFYHDGLLHEEIDAIDSVEKRSTIMQWHTNLPFH